ncbi:MAG TPA: hypothetical protein VMS86_00485 [Thermoanaerobaculia bacterium]|nr:hypothetical protein [Thermoanaerobaculia bacterium]
MHCTQARRLLQQGDAAAPGDRDAALDHLDHCGECAALAPRLDPVLLFRRLPELAVSAREVERVRDAVSILRRAPADPQPPRVAGMAFRFAAAIVAAAGLWLAPGPPRHEPRPPQSAPEARLAGPVPLPEYLASVETLGASGAYVATQVSEDDLTLVILANVDVAGR